MLLSPREPQATGIPVRSKLCVQLKGVKSLRRLCDVAFGSPRVGVYSDRNHCTASEVRADLKSATAPKEMYPRPLEGPSQSTLWWTCWGHCCLVGCPGQAVPSPDTDHGDDRHCCLQTVFTGTCPHLSGQAMCTASPCNF